MWYLRESPFVAADTAIIVSDVFHRRFWDPAQLENARCRQVQLYGHGDPADAFLPGEDFIRYAFGSGYDLMAYDETASASRLHELCTDVEHGLIFRTRRVFCAALRPRHEPVAASIDQLPTGPSPGPERHRRSTLAEVIRCGIVGRFDTRGQNERHFQQLRSLLESEKDTGRIDVAAYDLPVGKGLFTSLAQSARDLAVEWFDTAPGPVPRTITFWFGINTIDGQRYGLEHHGDWFCHPVDLGSPRGTPAPPTAYEDWTALCYNFFGSSSAVSRITKSYPWLDNLPPSSIYNWMMSASSDRSGWRSVSIVCPPDADLESTDASARLVEDALVLRAYAPHSVGEFQGHTLITLPGDAMAAFQLGGMLDGISLGDYCRDEKYSGPHRAIRTAVMCGLSSVYLDSLLLIRNHTTDNRLDLNAYLDTFQDRWLNNDQKVRFISPDLSPETITHEKWLEEGIVPLPAVMRDTIEQFIRRARSFASQAECLPVIWTSFLIRKPGGVGSLSTDESNEGSRPMATIMLMSDRPCDPALLELFTAHFQEVFFSIRSVEAEHRTKLHAAAEGRSRAVQIMLRSFGHDGRRYATAITSALGDGSNIGVINTAQRMAIAGYLSQSLASRLFVYQTLIGERRVTPSFYSDETSRRLKVVSLPDLVLREVAVILLRCAVEESEFRKLADRLILASIKAALIEFAQTAVSHSDLYPRAALAHLQESIRDTVILSWEGADHCRIPLDLNAEGNKTPVSRISVGLKFILSELLTNVFRHQFSQITREKMHPPVELRFAFKSGAAGYDLKMKTTPAVDPSPVLRNPPTGLQSMAFVANALGVQLLTTPVEWEGNVSKLPYPRFDVATQELLSEITNICPDALVFEE